LGIGVVGAVYEWETLGRGRNGAVELLAVMQVVVFYFERIIHTHESYRYLFTSNADADAMYLHERIKHAVVDKSSPSTPFRYSPKHITTTSVRQSVHPLPAYTLALLHQHTPHPTAKQPINTAK
jgi:hypothetical protein